MRFVCESCRAQYMINDEKVGPKGVKVRCRKCGYVILVKRADAAKAGGPVALSSDPDDALATQVMQTPVGASEATLNEDGSPEDQLTNPGVGPSSPSSPSLTAAEPALGPKDSFFGADEDEIGAVFDQVLRTGPQAVPREAIEAADARAAEDRQSTRVIDADTVKKLAEESGNGAPAGASVVAPAASPPGGGTAAPSVPQTDWYCAIDEKQTGPLTLDQLKRHWDDGEIGPDSLCWREGFDDWIPISQATALASVLAPKPPKPIVVAPAVTITQSTPAVMSVPVQSAFSAGGLMQTVQSEVQVPFSAAGAGAAPGEDVGWKPSAATALASLVRDEMEALAKPPPRAAPIDEPPARSMTGGLLDLPQDEKPAPVAAGAAAVVHDEPVERPIRPAPVPAPVNPYLANPGATYSAPAVTQYRPPEGNRNLILGVAGAAGVLVLLLIGLVVWLATRQPQVVVQPPPVAVAAPPVAPVAPAPPAQPAPAPAPVAAAPSPAPAPPPAPAADPEPAPAPPQPTTVVAAAPATPKVVAPTRPAPIAAQPRPAAAPRETSEPKRPAPAEEKDEFAAAFGGGSSSKSTAKEEPKPDSGKKTTYIPPAPGGGGDVKASLEQSDIMEVVLANKAGLAKCAEEQRKKEPGTSGKLVMRWTILTSGKTSNVGVVSEEFKGTYMASCVGNLIKGWTFPKHKTQGEPVSFPFKF